MRMTKAAFGKQHQTCNSGTINRIYNHWSNQRQDIVLCDAVLCNAKFEAILEDSHDIT